MIVKKTCRNRLTALINTANKYNQASPDIMMTVFFATRSRGKLLVSFLSFYQSSTGNVYTTKTSSRVVALDGARGSRKGFSICESGLYRSDSGLGSSSLNMECARWEIVWSVLNVLPGGWEEVDGGWWDMRLVDENVGAGRWLEDQAGNVGIEALGESWADWLAWMVILRKVAALMGMDTIQHQTLSSLTVFLHPLASQRFTMDYLAYLRASSHILLFRVDLLV